MRRLSYSGAFTTTKPFRTGPVGLDVDFLADIYPLSRIAAMPVEKLRCWEIQCWVVNASRALSDRGLEIAMDAHKLVMDAHKLVSNIFVS